MEALLNKLHHVEVYNKVIPFSPTAVVLHFKQILIKPYKNLIKQFKFLLANTLLQCLQL